MRTGSIRRIMTGFAEDGQSTMVAVDDVPVQEFAAMPGFAVPLIAYKPPDAREAVPTSDTGVLLPAPGGATFTFLSLPPDAQSARSDFDPAAAGAEMAARLPEFAPLFDDPARPGMHCTATVDYGIVLSGQVILEMEDGSRILLRPGDVFVQNATRHAWHNPGEAPALLAFVMLGITGPSENITDWGPL